MCSSLTVHSKDELKDWNDIKGRTLKRLWVKIKHPLHGRQRLTQLEEKEEKEYLAAFTTEKTAQARLEAAEAQISDLSKQVADVSRAAAQHDAVRAQLSQLYSSVFDGPTPAFPLEDIKEQAYNTALQQYNLVSSEVLTQLTDRPRRQWSTRSARSSCSPRLTRTWPRRRRLLAL